MKFIEDASKWWKMRSVQIFALIALLPEIWNMIVASGILDSMEDQSVPALFKRAVQAAALIGAIARLVKQKGFGNDEPAPAG